MAWEGSNRSERLPDDWHFIRRGVLRDAMYRCQAKLPSGAVCGQVATEVDHIHAGDDHRRSNLRAICTPCHKLKSSSEGGTAASSKRRQIKNRFRRTEDHPGAM